MGCVHQQRAIPSYEKLQKDLTLGAYTLRKEEYIARGACCSIWKVSDIDTGKNYALKEMRLRDKFVIDAYEKEVRLLNLAKQSRCNGEVEMLAYGMTKDPKVGRVGRILLELGTKTLIDQINQKDFTQLEVTIIIKEIAEALAELHELGVSHFDVKPDNIILVGQRYKICDFGSIKTQRYIYDDLDAFDKLNLQDFLEDHTTMHYRPPEMLNPKGQEIGPEADMWMLGCCLYMLAFGRHPFEDKDPSKIMNCQITYPHEGYFTEIVRHLFQKDPKQRLTAKNVVDILAKKLNSTTQ